MNEISRIAITEDRIVFYVVLCSTRWMRLRDAKTISNMIHSCALYSIYPLIVNVAPVIDEQWNYFIVEFN